MTELSKKYDVHPNQITKWKKQLLEHGSSVFKDSKDEFESDKDKLIAELYKTIGSLTMDVEFLKKSSRKGYTKASITEPQPVVISHIRRRLETKRTDKHYQTKTIINFATLTRKRKPL